MRQLHILKTPGTILFTPLCHLHFVPSLLISISVLLRHWSSRHPVFRRRSWRRISHYFERHLACHCHCSRRVSDTRALARCAAVCLIYRFYNDDDDEEEYCGGGGGMNMMMTMAMMIMMMMMMMIIIIMASTAITHIASIYFRSAVMPIKASRVEDQQTCSSDTVTATHDSRIITPAILFPPPCCCARCGVHFKWFFILPLCA
jgi:hypothetical protein